MAQAPLLSGLHNLPDAWRGAVIAIGNFDGVHRGHQAVLSAARATAQHHGVPCIAITFEPHPRTFFGPAKPVFRLTRAPAKAARLRTQNMDGTLVLPFDADLAAMSAEDFVRDIMVEKLAIRHAVTGYNFHFGHKRQGTPDYLVRAGAMNDFGVTLVTEFGDEAGAISSSRVRAALAEGALDTARELLGWDWSVIATVIEGEKRGRELGFPTANMALNPACRLAHGIYAVRYERQNGDCHDGVASFGRRPTFDKR
ncbi:MAG: riboflavin biosynthesis protein RibF [Alphaproteobacteria bacterium]